MSSKVAKYDEAYVWTWLPDTVEPFVRQTRWPYTAVRSDAQESID